MSQEVSYQYGQFGSDHLKKMEEGLLLFNAQKYWECHEAYEELWLEDRQDQARNVYWAIIQVAASLIHYRDQKLPGARGLIEKAKEKFKNCEKFSVETDLLYSYVDWKNLKNLVFQVPEECKLEDFQELFKFRFQSYPWSGKPLEEYEHEREIKEREGSQKL